jgi:hypothetical protein
LKITVSSRGGAAPPRFQARPLILFSFGTCDNSVFLEIIQLSSCFRGAFAFAALLLLLALDGAHAALQEKGATLNGSAPPAWLQVKNCCYATFYITRRTLVRDT